MRTQGALLAYIRPHWLAPDYVEVFLRCTHTNGTCGADAAHALGISVGCLGMSRVARGPAYCRPTPLTSSDTTCTVPNAGYDMVPARRAKSGSRSHGAVECRCTPARSFVRASGSASVTLTRDRLRRMLIGM